MSTLFISLATSGLPKSTGPMPWICRIAAALVDDRGVELDHYACTIRETEGRWIEPEAERRHGISTIMCARGGVDERLALGLVLGYAAGGLKRPIALPGLAASARTVVCWDAEFTRTILNARYAKHGEPHDSWRRPGLQFVGLQDALTPWCKLSGADDASGGYRKPTRDDAAFALLGLPMRSLPHSPDSNLERERALYAALCERNAIEGVAA